MPRSASVKDVAVAAGVSLGTVSNVLNRPDKVSPTTRERVERAMADLGFVRNESARQLRAGVSSTLAYVMLDAANPFFHDVTHGIDEVAEKAGMALLICSSNNRADREAAYLSRMEQQRVQGVLVTPVDPDAPEIAALVTRGTPVVFVDRAPSTTVLCSVSVDDVLGGRLAGEHLVDLGLQRVGFVGGPEQLGQVRDRRAGFTAAWRAAGRPMDALTVIPSEGLTVDDGRRAVRRLAELPAGTRPEGMFCANDLVALGMLQECVQQGWRVPEEMAIVGYDDIDFAAAAAVPLTSIRQPRERLGLTAAELLLDEVRNPDHEHQQLSFDPQLIVRASSAS